MYQQGLIYVKPLIRGLLLSQPWVRIHLGGGEGPKHRHGIPPLHRQTEPLHQEEVRPLVPCFAGDSSPDVFTDGPSRRTPRAQRLNCHRSKDEGVRLHKLSIFCGLILLRSAGHPSGMCS